VCMLPRSHFGSSFVWHEDIIARIMGIENKIL
jgi:hypothetical protein